MGGHFVIKPEPGRDQYVLWDTEYERPADWGDRARILHLLTEQAAEWNARHPDHPITGEVTPAARLDRADRCGSSAAGGYTWGYWDHEVLIYEQRGYLPRTALLRACELLALEDEPGVWDLMTPFEDLEEVRRG